MPRIGDVRPEDVTDPELTELLTSRAGPCCAR
jgi:hypothetical protein